MMTNNNNHLLRPTHMTLSSMFNPRAQPQPKFDGNFPPSTNSIDSLPKPRQFKLEQTNTRMLPRGLASQSMIDTNTSARRLPFGKLDSMARVVTPAFQQDSPHDTKTMQAFGKLDSMARVVTPSLQQHSPSLQQHSPHHTNNPDGFGKLDNMARVVKPAFQQDSLHDTKKTAQMSTFQYSGVAQSMISESPNALRRNPGQQFKTNPMQGLDSLVKKRRESIDLGMASKRQQNHEAPLFLRKNKDLDQTNKQTFEGPTPQAQLDLKNKNFQFLKKRREASQNQSAMTTSMIGVQSMKVLPNYYTHSDPTIKKPEFLSPHQNKFTQQFSPVVCPQDKQKSELADKTQMNSRSPNFEFKKKKLFESPTVEAASPKPAFSKEGKKDLLTVKEKMAMKNTREIKLEDFEILQKLGKGAFGDVFIAQEKAIGFVCVIKKMSKKRIRQAKVQQHILREIKIQSYLNNQHLTALFGYFHDQQNLYLILQALPDGSLQNVKKKKKLPEKDTAAIVKQVAVGLKFMHEEYLIHRDLKPQNIFMHDGIAKIGDFGCSIYNRDLALRNTVVGCLEYSSPEQLSKEGYSEKIDSWSLGILTFELLFGKSPFESDIIKIAKNKDLKPELSTLNFPQGIPIKPETKNFIENLLNEDPDRRMDMDEVLNHQFLKEQMSKKAMKLQEFV